MMKKTCLAAAVLAAFSTPIFANDESNSNWIFRTGVAQVTPNDDSGTILGGSVGVDSSTGVGLSLTYMLDSNWGIEVLGALPFTHDIEGSGALSGVSIGETKQLPPTFSLIYQWGNETKYHVGAGLNYTEFFDEKSDADLNNALGVQSDLELDSSTGLAVKFGFDTPVSKNWNFSGSLYYIQIDTTADVIVNNAVAASVDVDIDPWVLMLGVSTQF
ncbi:OmpW/AlkL family protein [Aliikangiella coralliicola]|uniref:Outer membrane beta-barrel protein n=1 Tax=Aliikangiella coralliicola TaxID=2592383 RepID=A0A545TSS5_9GAMM|nr:OmpW family outer membrane protein [Aliikangiella coralliicola]TQV80269.1 outer membrane beta-barrel protein [Aliikangiella coralliicola]